MDKEASKRADIRDMMFAIEITLVGITAGVLSIPYNSFLLSVIAGGVVLAGLVEAARIRASD